MWDEHREHVEVDNENLSPFIAPYAEMVKGG
jgi:hypothetical protein